MGSLAVARPSGFRIRVSAHPRMDAEELRGLLFRPEMIEKWLGPGVVLPPKEGALATVPGVGGALTKSLVTSAAATGNSYSLSSDGGGSSVRLTITISPEGSLSKADSSVVRVTVGRIPGVMDTRLTLAFWQAALNKLESIVHAIRRRRSSPKQALLVIHGMGEQLPGQTLMEFVRAVFGVKPEDPPRWMKPDTLSSSFETRKVTIKAAPAPRESKTNGAGRNVDSEGRPTTDVYELYWAHLIRDSTTRQVLSWINDLLRRIPNDMPQELKPLMCTLRGLKLLVLLGVPLATVATFFNPHYLRKLLRGGGGIGVAATVGGLSWKLLKQPGNRILTDYLGDVARYFEPKPDNIARRQEIREAGVRLIEKLHETGDYDRIIIASHSLGSAIAYDILTFAWNRLRQQHEAPDRVSLAAFTAVEKQLSPPVLEATTDITEARALQFAAWQEHRRNTQPWLVTDLITMGSPLAHGDLVMAASQADFKAMKNERIFPTCPPHTDSQLAGNGRLGYPLPDRSINGSDRDPFIVPDQGALFAFTRWTNLYFPLHGFVGGDLVGGPLKEKFGKWIWDRPVKTKKVGFMGVAHTCYWDEKVATGSYVGSPGEDHLDCLIHALDLNAVDRLRTLASQIPAFTYLRKR